MTDRTAAEVMCCPDGCEKDTMLRLRGVCHASGFTRNVERLHAAGYMIVLREPSTAMLYAGYAARTSSRPEFDIYRAMTTEGELK